MTKIIVSDYTVNDNKVTLNHSRGTETRDLSEFQEWCRKNKMPDQLNTLRHIHDDVNRWEGLYKMCFSNWLNDEADEKEIDDMERDHYYEQQHISSMNHLPYHESLHIRA